RSLFTALHFFHGSQCKASSRNLAQESGRTGRCGRRNPDSDVEAQPQSFSPDFYFNFYNLEQSWVIGILASGASAPFVPQRLKRSEVRCTIPGFVVLIPRLIPIRRCRPQGTGYTLG